MVIVNRIVIELWMCIYVARRFCLHLSNPDFLLRRLIQRMVLTRETEMKAGERLRVLYITFNK
ncbi:MAG: hypothetical protein ABIN25_06390 [Ginsengibacter sp.]